MEVVVELVVSDVIRDALILQNSCYYVIVH